MYASQFAYDMAEEPVDPRHEVEDRIGDQLDDGDRATAEAFAEYAYDRMRHDDVVAAMAALFRISDSKWRTLRNRLDDVVGMPLDNLRNCMEAYREDFIAERAGQLLEDAA